MSKFDLIRNLQNIINTIQSAKICKTIILNYTLPLIKLTKMNNYYMNQQQNIELHNINYQQPIVMGIPVRQQQHGQIQNSNYDLETINTLNDESQQFLLANQQNNISYSNNSNQQQGNMLGQQRQINIAPQQNTESQNNQEFIIHKILPTDTLLGISIQYQVSEHRIKVANDLHSDEIYYKKELKIPNPKANNLSNLEIDPVKAREDQLIFFFKHKILQGKDQQTRVARIYLEAADWDINQAQQDYNEDLEAEQKDKKNKKYK
ncbi:LysM domain protein (macronuclear) [Tetrahymena thermophila SB210]|uniref:LysM domain protein n=1 Tax=Tetrahymena thermophila (strain SB210) TaxID=312017 RepID=W7XEP0_TETTS|nr:LysM domain protein [Tetrahymena thermophila SB210]EWS72356.1 LysM domain protein [Tetrahymena thermophila SB210]|eukprot:XP_012655104.1 LysM domain protein [Tetrahymena thermophila SB210]